MPRTARFLKDDSCYYIKSESFQRKPIFKSDADYEHYIFLLKKYKLRLQINLYGYCLVPREVHLIIHPDDASKLPVFMQGVNQSYAISFNSLYKCEGKVWGQRYKSVVINNDYDLFECIKSVEFVPVREQQSSSPVLYPWSSCADRILGRFGVIGALPVSN